jgi:nucleoside-diphosphate-sugar epimerase
MRVCVTGNRGYVGTVLTPLLRAAGHDVVGIDADFYRRCSFPCDVALPDIATEVKDIRDVEAKDFDRCDAVVHLAGLANDPLGEIDPELTAAINHHATMRLADCAKRAGVRRFLFASTCSVYGAAGESVVDEESPTRPVTAYGHSKLAAESDLVRLADGNFVVLSLRCATAYGASPRLRFDLVVNNLVAWAKSTGRILLKSDATAWRPLVHVEDIARAYVAFLVAPQSAFAAGVVNIGANAENLRIRDLADQVAAAVPGSTVSFAANAGRDPRSYRVDFSRLRRALPTFSSVWSAGSGAAQLARILDSSPVGPEDFDGAAYQRHAHLLARLKASELDRNLRPVARIDGERV